MDYQPVFLAFFALWGAASHHFSVTAGRARHIFNVTIQGAKHIFNVIVTHALNWIYYLRERLRVTIVCLYQFLLFHVPLFLIHLIYVMFISLMGFLALKGSKPTTDSHAAPNNLDLFFMSVSVSTLSGLSVVEIEVFSEKQLTVIAIIMLLGGEMFISLIGLIFTWINIPLHQSRANDRSNPNSSTLETPNPSTSETPDPSTLEAQVEPHESTNQVQNGNVDVLTQRRNSIRCLGFVVLAYQIIVYLGGWILSFSYLNIERSAKEILKNKHRRTLPFSLFITLASFFNCGLVPTNENMIIFKKHSGLLFIHILLILMGNTLYPPFLRLCIWALKKCSNREEFPHILNNHRSTGYHHMLSYEHCIQLPITVGLLLLAQLLLFWLLEFKSEIMEGLNFGQKCIVYLFQTVNSRHAGESVLDLSTLSSALLVFFAVIMYLPPYTTFWVIWDNTRRDNDTRRDNENERKSWVEKLVFSQIIYLAIFVLLICFTERNKIQRDPINFNLLSITIEVIGAYGNVGWSRGYDCKRQLKLDDHCQQSWTSLAGRYSTGGKVILIIVMIFGKLKNFSRNGGESWTLYSD